MKVAEWKTKQSEPRIVEDDPQIVLRRILLNSLMKTPVPKEKVIASARRQFGFRREDVLRAATWWNCIEEMRDGEVHWRKPDVLVALSRWHYARANHPMSSSLKPMQAYKPIVQLKEIANE